MTTAIRTEPSVARVQKTLQFHEDLARLVQAYSDRKGTSFQRVVQSAVLQHFFSQCGDPDGRWLAAFGQLERAEGDPPVNLGTLPIRFHEQEADRLSRKLARIKAEYAATPAKTPEHEEIRNSSIASFERAILLHEHQAATWRTVVSAHGGGVDGIIDLYTSTGPDEFMLNQVRFEEEHPDD